MKSYADPLANAEIARLRAENEALRAKVARVEAVRARVIDVTQHLIEGPLIGRLKVGNWLNAALADPKGDADASR